MNEARVCWFFTQSAANILDFNIFLRCRGEKAPVLFTIAF